MPEEVKFNPEEDKELGELAKMVEEAGGRGKMEPIDQAAIDELIRERQAAAAAAGQILSPVEFDAAKLEEQMANQHSKTWETQEQNN